MTRQERIAFWCSAVACGAFLCAFVAGEKANSQPAYTPPPAAAAPASVVVPYNAAVYGQPSGFTAADAKRLLELTEANGTRQEKTNELLAQLLARPAGGPVAAAAPKLDVLAVSRAKCAACHTPGRADDKGGGYVLFADESAKAFKPVSSKDRAAENGLVRKEVTDTESMPKGGRLSPAERALFQSPVFK